MKKFFAIITVLWAAACQPGEQNIAGYVEGEFVMVAPTSSGVLKTLSVERGQIVKAGDRLFSLDLTELTAERNRAEAEALRMQAERDDLLKGKRQQEIDVILKQILQARVTLVHAKKEYDRILPLSKTGVASLSSRDNAKAALDSARARIDELNAQLKTATLSARSDKIKAATASLESAKQTLIQIEKKLKDAAPTAPVAGTVADTFFRPGEFVAGGRPVVSLLPPGNIKIRFFVSQEMVAKLKPEQTVTITCDGCKVPVTARISYIAPEAEYTPPVIYSVESRDKLVFLIEAKPDQYSSQLRPGLPVDIDTGL